MNTNGASSTNSAVSTDGKDGRTVKDGCYSILKSIVEWFDSTG
jgi:hypothetical protein